MKKLSENTKFNLRNGFGSLVSNRAAIECGRSFPWWTAIIIGLLGAFLPIIPIMVNIANTNGDSYLTGQYNYGFDKNLSIGLVNLNNAKKEFKVDSDHYLSYYVDDVKQTPTEPVVLTEYINPLSKQYDVRYFYLVETTVKGINDYYNEYVGNQFKLGTTTLKTKDDPTDTKYYTPTMVFFHKEGFSVYVPKYNSTTAGTKFSGNFVNVAPCDIVKRLATVNGKIPATINDIDAAYMTGALDNMKLLSNEAYSDIKAKSLLYTSLIYYGIYVGLILLLGLLIFILTRGKRNINNYLKWYQCMAISGWASFSPGILGLILGFMLTSYALMFFILFFGVRIMWLTMKQLSPTYQGQ